MIKLHVLGSGSSGNSYILESDREALIIDAGVNPIEMKKALNWNISKITSVWPCHRHKDHCKYARDYEQMGCKVFTLPDVIEQERLTLAHPVEHKHRYQVGEFSVLVLNMAHDVPCVGYVISHPEMGKLLYATDTYILPYRIPGLNYIMVECNYSDNALEWAIEQGRTPSAMRERLLTSHMELNALKGWFLKNDLSAANEIVLLHLSGNNSAPDTFKKEIEKITGKPTYIAKKGLELDLSLQPY